MRMAVIPGEPQSGETRDRVSRLKTVPARAAVGRLAGTTKEETQAIR